MQTRMVLFSSNRATSASMQGLISFLVLHQCCIHCVCLDLSDSQEPQPIFMIPDDTCEHPIQSVEPPTARKHNHLHTFHA